MSYIHLHVHSEYSLVDGIVRITDLVETAKKQGSTAIALTDQSNLFAMVKFYEAAEEAGIKPIIGVDVWIQNEQDLEHPFRLILLCQNAIGYRNATELVSLAYREGQLHDKAQIKKAWLENHHQGLIAIASSCESDIARALLNQQNELAAECIEYWTKLFQNRFYLEVTRIDQPEETAYLQAVVTFAENTGCPLVATNAVRFMNRDDFEAHEARVSINQGYVLNDPQRPKIYTEEQYLKTPDEMLKLFSDIPEALQNSIEIAKRCNLEIQLGAVHLPKFPVPSQYTLESYFKEQAEQGLLKRFQQSVPEEYKTRLNIELNVLNEMGYAGYFLIVADFIQWAKNNGIPVGPGRGSGAGSLVAYSLNITDLDPLQYDLLFERFLNPERVSMPDFDIDFCMEGRDRVIEYVAEKYGRDSVSQIITFGTMAAKAVIRDAGRVLGHPYGFVDKIAKLIPFELGITLDKALVQEELLKQLYNDDEEVKILIDLAKKLEGITRNAGKHAGGVVIAPSKLTDFTPLYCDATEGITVTQFDKNDVESIGLVKFDFLGLRTLTIIDWAVQSINEMQDQLNKPKIDIHHIPLTDQKTFDLLRSCHTTAVFQLESRGMKDLVRRLEPDVFEEIIALVALFRPGPLQSGMVDDFINRKHGRATPEYLHENLVQILKPTYGVILYQEQVMQIAQVLAGYTLGGADLLRRAMGKKKPEEMAKHRNIFVKGAVERGVEESRASYIFDLMEKFAGYGFNKSHSAAYALITYQTAWLKAHFPSAFMAAVLSSDMAHTDKVVNFIEECRILKISVIPPDINKSQYKFRALKEGPIVYGLGAIKGVGEAAIESILEARADAHYRDLFDLCARVDARKVTRRVLEALVKSGALDCFQLSRSQLMASIEDAILASEQLSKNREQGQGDLFGGMLQAEDVQCKIVPKNVAPWSDDTRLQGEKETLGLYLTGHPLAQYQADLEHITTTQIRSIGSQRGKQIIAGLIMGFRTLITKKGDKMAFVSVDDGTGRQEIAVFSEQYRENKAILVKDNLIVVEGDISLDEYSGGFKMRCINLYDFEMARTRFAKYIEIEINLLATNQTMVNLDFSEKLKSILIPYRGNGCTVRINYLDHEKKTIISCGKNWTVRPTQILLNELNTVSECIQAKICY